MAKNLKTLLKNVFGVDVQDDTMLLGVAYDSRAVLPGDCFCAFAGSKADGRHFIEDAIEKGANAVLLENDLSMSEPMWYYYEGKSIPVYKLSKLPEKLGELAAWFYGYPSLNMKVIGVTGTNGKTSYCHLLASALHYLGFKTAVLGTLGYGFLGNLKPSMNTTLNAIDNQKLLAEFRDKGTECVVMEVSSHALDQGRVGGIYFAMTAFTNLTQDHLDYHRTMENYALTKSKLFSVDIPAIINQDDALGKKLLSTLDDTIAYSLAYQYFPKKFICASDYVCTREGVKVDFKSSFGSGSFSSPLIGEFNISNLLAVAASLLRLGVNIDDVIAVLPKLTAVPGRMERFGGGDLPTIYVDYAHTPDALEKALKALRPLSQGKLYCIFGCGGNRDKGKRAKMAAVAEAFSDLIMVTSDNSRLEDPELILEDIKQGFKEARYFIELDRTAAIRHILSVASSDDTILIAGKGRETVQDINHQKIPYSDIETVCKLLEETTCYTH